MQTILYENKKLFIETIKQLPILSSQTIKAPNGYIIKPE